MSVVETLDSTLLARPDGIVLVAELEASQAVADSLVAASCAVSQLSCQTDAGH